MSKEDILKTITNTFVKVLEHDNFTLTESTTANDVDGWESVTHMMIITDIENTFNIRISSSYKMFMFFGCLAILK